MIEISRIKHISPTTSHIPYPKGHNSFTLNVKIHYLIVLLIFLIVAFTACENYSPLTKTESANDFSEKIYIERGKKIAQNAFETLSGNLQKAMQEGGVEHAIKFCNINASDLVKSLNKKHNVEVKRTSLKVRNQNNTPTSEELVQLMIYQKQNNEGKELKPTAKKIKNNKVVFYSPIHIKPLCLSCHGKVGEVLLTTNHNLIKSLYPNDKATGYSNGDLRGMWSITFSKN